MRSRPRRWRRCCAPRALHDVVLINRVETRRRLAGSAAHRGAVRYAGGGGKPLEGRSSMLAVIRGAGDIASAIALRLVRCGASVLMTEIGQPLTVRRTVAFSEAVRMGKAQVEGVTAVRARDVSHALELLSGEGVVPVLVDPACACVKDVAPDAVVDAVLAKRNLGTCHGYGAHRHRGRPGLHGGRGLPCRGGDHARAYPGSSVLRGVGVVEHRGARFGGRLRRRARAARPVRWRIPRRCGHRRPC